MSWLPVLAVLAWLSAHGACTMWFIVPPPFGKELDYSENPVYIVGDSLTVGWTAGKQDTGASLVLYQLNKTTGVWFGDGEYLTQNAFNTQAYNWLVGTRKDLEDSDLFYFSIFEEGQTSSDSNSHYFYIRKEGDENTSTSSTATASATASSRSSTATSTPTESRDSPPLPPTSTGDPSNSDSSSSLGAGAIAGIVVGIVAALALGFGLAFMLFRRRSHKRMDGPPMSANPYEDRPPAELHNWNVPVEADTTAKYGHHAAPVELGDTAPMRHG